MNAELTSLFDTNTLKLIYNAAVANSQEILKESKSTRLELCNKLIVKDELNNCSMHAYTAAYNSTMILRFTRVQVLPVSPALAHSLHSCTLRTNCSSCILY